ncbi:hypothetical protein ACQ86E_10275 [Bradyrhizobium betae]|uniref:hypothetical protein n=1 Tax=Bradyrhizobium betae TaxID=244734 RepID=UPI003D66AD16
MARGNDGLGMGPEFWAPLPGQDRKHFPLGTCPAPPARGYWAARAGLSNDYQVEEAIAGLTDPSEIKAKLIKLAGYNFALDYMTYYKMGWKY